MCVGWGPEIQHIGHGDKHEDACTPLDSLPNLAKTLTTLHASVNFGHPQSPAPLPAIHPVMVTKYVDDIAMIPEITLVLKPIIVEADKPKVVEKIAEDLQSLSSAPVVDPSAMVSSDETEWNGFGDDLFAIPCVVPIQQSNFKVDVSPSDAAGEEMKYRMLMPERCFGKGMDGRMVTSHVYSLISQ